MADDLTKGDVLERARDEDEGTGIYWFIDQRTGQPQKMFIPRITHTRADELARDLDRPGRQVVDAYRWVPDYVERADSLVNTVCGGRCNSDLDCVNNACRCINNICQ
jgi:hypothetical protein